MCINETRVGNYIDEARLITTIGGIERGNLANEWNAARDHARLILLHYSSLRMAAGSQRAADRHARFTHEHLLRMTRMCRVDGCTAWWLDFAPEAAPCAYGCTSDEARTAWRIQV